MIKSQEGALYRGGAVTLLQRHAGGGGEVADS